MFSSSNTHRVLLPPAIMRLEARVAQAQGWPPAHQSSCSCKPIARPRPRRNLRIFPGISSRSSSTSACGAPASLVPRPTDRRYVPAPSSSSSPVTGSSLWTAAAPSACSAVPRRLTPRRAGRGARSPVVRHSSTGMSSPTPRAQTVGARCRSAPRRTTTTLKLPSPSPWPQGQRASLNLSVEKQSSKEQQKGALHHNAQTN